MAGKFITLEGIDGAGKSTHIAWLADRLSAAGREVVVTREPGGTPLGEKLRAALLHEPMDVATETLLIFAARQEHLVSVIRPALQDGAWVISDRFTDATFAYQGGGRGFPTERLDALQDWVHSGFQPDLTLLFDLPAAVGQTRLADAAGARDRFERAGIEFQERVRAAYLARAREFPERFRVIDATASLEHIKKKLEISLATL